MTVGAAEDASAQGATELAVQGFDWPGVESERKDWWVASGRAGMRICDLQKRVRAVLPIVETLIGHGAFADAEELVSGLIPTEAMIAETGKRVELWLHAARLHMGAGREEDARKALGQARGLAETIKDDFWRRNAVKGVERCASAIGVLSTLRPLTTEEQTVAQEIMGKTLSGLGYE